MLRETRAPGPDPQTQRGSQLTELTCQPCERAVLEVASPIPGGMCPAEGTRNTDELSHLCPARVADAEAKEMIYCHVKLLCVSVVCYAAWIAGCQHGCPFWMSYCLLKRNCLKDGVATVLKEGQK